MEIYKGWQIDADYSAPSYSRWVAVKDGEVIRAKTYEDLLFWIEEAA